MANEFQDISYQGDQLGQVYLQPDLDPNTVADFGTIVPLWRGPFIPPYTANIFVQGPAPEPVPAPAPTEEIVLTQPSSENGGFWEGLFGAAVNAFSSPQIMGPRDVAAQGIGDALGRILTAPFRQEAVTTRVQGATACWQPRGGGKPKRNARVRVIRMADGTVGTELYCAKPRMNPLNPRALSRASRRLASFQRIAKGIDHMINTQICKGKKSRRAPAAAAPAACAPKRCR